MSRSAVSSVRSHRIDGKDRHDENTFTVHTGASAADAGRASSAGHPRTIIRRRNPAAKRRLTQFQTTTIDSISDTKVWGESPDTAFVRIRNATFATRQQ